MALRLCRRAIVGGQFPWGHDHLALYYDCRTDAFQNHAHHAHNGMHLRQVAAGRSECFPDIGHRVYAQYLDTQVGQIQHAFDHLHQHSRIAVIEIPLVRVEGGQHPPLHFFVPGKITRRGIGKHLRHRLLIQIGDGSVRVAAVVVLVHRVTGLGAESPRVGVSGVVHHKIQAEADACHAQLLRQGGEVGVRAQGRVHGVEILHRVSPVVVGVRHFEQRHQVQVGDPLLLQISQLLYQLFEVAGKQVGVHGHALHRTAAVPVRIFLSIRVQCPQFRAAPGISGEHLGFQRVECSAVVVQLHEQPFQLILMPGQAVLPLFLHGIFLSFRPGCIVQYPGLQAHRPRRR